MHGGALIIASISLTNQSNSTQQRFRDNAISTTPLVAGQGPEKARHAGILLGITYVVLELKGVGPKFSAWYPIFRRRSLILGPTLNLGGGRYC